MLKTFPRCVARFHNTTKLDTKNLHYAWTTTISIRRICHDVDGPWTVFHLGSWNSNPDRSMWDSWTTKLQGKSFLPKLPLFLVNINPPTYQAQSFTHHHRCIILAIDSDTSLLDRWAGDLKVHAKIKYVTPKCGFGVTHPSFGVRCIRANSRLNFEITLIVCMFQALFSPATATTEM